MIGELIMTLKMTEKEMESTVKNGAVFVSLSNSNSSNNSWSNSNNSTISPYG